MIAKNKWLLVFLFVPIAAFNLSKGGYNHFVYLSHSLINGSFSFQKLPSPIWDLSYYNGDYFLPLGIFPAFILTPFVAIFGTNFPENLIKLPITIINFLLVIKISKALKLSPEKSIWTAIFFIFGSIYTPTATIPYSTYTSHVISVCLLLFAIHEFLYKSRWLLIGLALALAALTRPTLILSSLFFLIFLVKKPLATNFLKFGLPIAMTAILIAFYNHARFNNFLETGHNYQIVPQQIAQKKEGGLFSVKYIPSNLYYMLIKTPNPIVNSSGIPSWPYLAADKYGMSIFLISPVLFLLFKTELKDKLSKASLAAVFAIAFPITTYYGIGFQQIGYRYALDFFPFLMIILMSAVKKVTESSLKLLVILSVVITWYFILVRLSGF